MDLRELVERARLLGFEWKFCRDYDGSHWITLYKDDAPIPAIRYQFHESAEGLSQLYQFLQSYQRAC